MSFTFMPFDFYLSRASGSPDGGAVIGRYKMTRSIPGRAQVITRDAGRIAAQLAWSDPIA